MNSSVLVVLNPSPKRLRVSRIGAKPPAEANAHWEHYHDAWHARSASFVRI